MIALLGIILSLLVPFLIVGLWRKRPVAAFILASVVLLLILSATSIIKTFQAMMIYGEGDPQLVAGGISEAIVSGGLKLIFALPLLYLFQWFVRRRDKNKLAKTDIDKTFT